MNSIIPCCGASSPEIVIIVCGLIAIGKRLFQLISSDESLSLKVSGSKVLSHSKWRATHSTEAPSQAGGEKIAKAQEGQEHAEEHSS